MESGGAVGVITDDWETLRLNSLEKLNLIVIPGKGQVETGDSEQQMATRE